MNRIEHDAADSKLSKAIDQYNDRLAEHQATAAAIRTPPDIADDELLTMDVATLQTHAEALLSERLKHQQDGIILARQRIELLEAIEAETKARADQADVDYNSIHNKTAAKLEKAGLGPAAQQAGKISPRIAERQFQYQVGQSVDVKAAEAEKRHQRGQLSHCIQLIAAAKASLADAQSKLRDFVVTQIKGNGNQNGQATLRDSRRKNPDEITVPAK